ncbi:MAG: lipoate--protein ligase [Clostridia bacterium]|nr:lipoate--protein ligase [Clostridia bacterium]
MKIYRNDATDPYFNLAAEEYLMDTEPDDVFMLWQNEPSVIIGRNQNAYAEINRSFVEEHHIPVVRRLTGGGAVFHDLGNLCFTFIVSHEKCPEMDFSRFCRPIIEALQALGVPAALSGRNDMTVEGKKFSGNAETVHNGKVLHHGTILFSADLSRLAGALKVDEEKIRSKGIKSVRSRVCNLSDYLPSLTVAELKNYLEASVSAESVSFTEKQIRDIEALAKEKYASWDWIFGTSKQYGTTVKKRFPYGSVALSYTADRGVLTEVGITGDYFGAGDVAELEAALIGCRLEREALAIRLTNASCYILGAKPQDLLDLFLQ